jgi:hypothetical protein
VADASRPDNSMQIKPLKLSGLIYSDPAIDPGYLDHPFSNDLLDKWKN